MVKGFVVMDLLLEIEALYKELVGILEAQRKRALVFIIKELHYSLHLMDAYKANPYHNPTALKALHLELLQVYKGINQPHIGLSDFYIHHDDFETRVQLNEPLSSIQHKLSHVFYQQIEPLYIKRY